MRRPPMRRLVLTGIFTVCLSGPRCLAADWTYNMAFSNWAVSNKYDRYHTFTPESADQRAAELAQAGYTAVIVSGYHFRLDFLDRDDDVRRIARIITDACHRHGLKVIEHVDLTLHFYDGYPLAFEHPDWLQLSAADMLTRHRIYCPNNPEFQEAYLEYFRRFQRETNVDAYQMDEIQWLSRDYCACRHCQAKYTRDTGRAYPPIHDPGFWERAHSDPEYRAWMRWRLKALADFRRLVAEDLRKIRPGLKMFTYTTASQSDPSCLDRGACLEARTPVCDTVGTEVNAVPFLSYPSIYATLKSRTALSAAYGKAAWAKLEFTEPSAYFCWAFGRTARHSLWFSMSPTAKDPSPQELLLWPHQMDDAEAAVAADVGVLLSTSTRDLRPDPEFYHCEYEGWLQALLLNHHDVKVILESRLRAEPDPLEGLGLLVLPNVAALSAGQSRALLQYVNNGGRLLLTADSGTLDLDGDAATPGLLRDAGITIAASRDGPVAIGLQPAGTYELSYRQVQLAERTHAVVTMAADDHQLPLLARRGTGRGEIWYLAAKLGNLAFEPQQLPPSKSSQGFQPPRDPRAVDLIGDIAERVLAEIPHFAISGAPRGLLTGLYRTQRDGRRCRVLHLLNATGRDVSPGDRVDFERDRPLPMPSLPELGVRIPGAVSRAILASPELKEPLPLAVESDGRIAVITVPAHAFGTYGVIWAYE